MTKEDAGKVVFCPSLLEKASLRMNTAAYVLKGAPHVAMFSCWLRHSITQHGTFEYLGRCYDKRQGHPSFGLKVHRDPSA